MVKILEPLKESPLPPLKAHPRSTLFPIERIRSRSLNPKQTLNRWMVSRSLILRIVRLISLSTKLKAKSKLSTSKANFFKLVQDTVRVLWMPLLCTHLLICPWSLLLPTPRYRPCLIKKGLIEGNEETVGLEKIPYIRGGVEE